MDLKTERNQSAQKKETVRITAWLRLKGTSGVHLVQPCHSSRLPRSMFRQYLTISKDADSTTSLGNLGQCLVTLTVKRCFWMFRGNHLCFSVCSLPLVLLLGTTGMNVAPSFVHPPCRYFYILKRSP